MKFMTSPPADRNWCCVSIVLVDLHFQSHGKLHGNDFSCCICHYSNALVQLLNATTIYTEDLALATTVLRSFICHSVEDVSKNGSFKQRYGSVRRVFIVAAEDKLLRKEFQQHEKVILVGHSLGGFAISKAMEIFPEKISVAVFVTALMPGPTLNANPSFLLICNVTEPLYLYSLDDMSKEIVLSSKRYGSVRRVFIVAAEDKTLPKQFQQWMIEKNPPDEERGRWKRSQALITCLDV
ncbi:hypothetical protein HAX54_049694 [Datura stramonium]|uniref:AB hydrolase-1 domain-containing protein n=1 Tax=Datura stramonium TaxID=4076 RepID=A0ABS8SW54_DATST|nr:hypothetical protein [Datura stramonium]